jgi:hypothetical protein
MRGRKTWIHHTDSDVILADNGWINKLTQYWSWLQSRQPSGSDYHTNLFNLKTIHGK